MIRRALALAVVAACGAPARVSSPAVRAAVTPADITKIFIDPATAPNAKPTEQRADLAVFSISTERAAGLFTIEPWDPVWPDDSGAFERARAANRKVRFDIKQRSIVPDEWLFRGTLVLDGDTTWPAFEMVRTIGGARFLCSGLSEKDDLAEVEVDIVGCRAARL